MRECTLNRLRSSLRQFIEYREANSFFCHSGSCPGFVRDRSGIFLQKDSRRGSLGGMTGLRHMVLEVIIVLIMMVSALPAFAAEKSSLPLKGLSRAEAMRLGEAMYRDGILPSGEYMQAVVEGDIPVEGSMFTCANCHMRSGLGSVEGTIISPPTNGEQLYRSRKGGQEFTEQQKKNLPSHFRTRDIRTAYTDKTLAQAIRAGVNPSGRKLDPIMPRYQLSGRELQILVYYLKNLSSAPSPGVTETTIRFATVVGEGVSKDERDAVLLPLETYVKDRNARAPYYKARGGYRLFAEEMDRSYRRLSLTRWELKGPPATWRSQLEAHYRKEPVFALLGGIVEGSWSPVHEFCEQNRVPCILPITDQPVISDTDWYTLYFSKGPFQEGEAAAKYLRTSFPEDDHRPVLQVFRKTTEGRELSRGFRETWKNLGMPLPAEKALDPGEEMTDSVWTELSEQYRGGVLVLWLGMKDVSRLAGPGGNIPPIIISSSTVMGEDLSLLPEKLRPHTFITYPHRLPQERGIVLTLVRPWLKHKKIPETDFDKSSKVYFLGTLLTDVFMHMKMNFYRDHFLDVIDMLEDESDSIVNYPRLSFGPGQRYASKGCYIVQLSSGEKPEIIRKSDWVIH